MKNAHSEVEKRLNTLQGLLYAAGSIGAWCFSESKYLYKSTAPHQEEYLVMLEQGGCLDLAIAQKDRSPKPVLLDGRIGLSWIGEWVYPKGQDPFLVFLGPMFLKNSSVEDSLQRMDRLGLTLERRQQYLNSLRDIPYIHSEMFSQYARMLHFICYEENLGREDIRFETIEQKAPEAGPEPSENDFQRMHTYEQHLLKQLGEGVPPQAQENDYPGELQDFHLKDSKRQLKDNLIILTALCARTAIEKGVSAYAAKKMESRWVHKIETARGIGDAQNIIPEMYGEFQHLIRASIETEGFSPAVQKCRDYIRMNYTRDIDLGSLAAQCGYTEYYLTRKFAKETGMKLTDYVRTVRVDAAKVMLLTSQKEIPQIAEELRFGSRSYFDRIFLRETGMSPARFRENAGNLSLK